MADSLYIVTLEPDSGKFLVTVGLMELLSRKIRRVGFFRPVIPASTGPNNEIAVIRQRYKLQYPYEASYAYRYDEAIAMAGQGRGKEMMEGIVAKFKALEQQCDFVLCLGLDITGLSSVFDYDINVDIARSLGVTIQWFFASEAAVDPADAGYVVRRNTLMSVHYEDGIIDELLTPQPSRQLEILHSRFPPGTYSQQSYSHEDDECS